MLCYFSGESADPDSGTLVDHLKDSGSRKGDIHPDPITLRASVSAVYTRGAGEGVAVEGGAASRSGRGGDGHC